MKKIYFTLLVALFICNYTMAQAVNYDVELVALERINYNDCGACGAPDPTWKVGIYDNINPSSTNSCFHIDGNTTLNSPLSTSLRSQISSLAGSITISFEGFEKNCNNDNCNFIAYNFITCFPSVYGDGNRCTNANLETINFRNSQPCVWHNDTTPYCGDYRFIYRYKWNFNAAPIITTH